MNATATDTIAAIATPPGRGGVGVLRITGPAAPAIAKALGGSLPAPRRASLREFRDADGERIDQGLLLYFPAPHSFTGEDVVELHAHGGPVVLDMLLSRVFALGARPARAGEFSLRAFLNDKLDLAQAEAIADLIDSETEQAARAATRSLQGLFSQQVRELVEGLTELRTWVEAAIDFPDEEIDFLSDGQIEQRLVGVRDQLKAVRRDAGHGCLLRDGMTLVIAGRPNAGKSSLLNALAGSDAAIVTAVAGTTRDLLRERIQIEGIPLHLVDTAGLRDTDDPVESEGVRRAWNQIGQADRVLLVIDDREGFTAADREILQRLPTGLPCTRILNKIDLSGRAAGETLHEGVPAMAISARTGAGLDALRRHILETAGNQGQESAQGSFSARRRHLDALERAAEHLNQAAQCLANGQGELLAEELRLAQLELSAITGEFSSDDLLGEIFAGFCIGK
ncbi:MAG TPA: tRNA uridine-5-carboxymethylaminomethyl(34) synthesis GTPase MnmE [Gammaproteobacteria bacterium]|nr:tRNA uridine-5-carboxymethylaminomethyl(34) synthesis GTPase MnmE [Gammaproteobacteria bacterium]